MKKLILSAALIAGMAMASYGQSTVQASNSDNTDTSSTATTGGLFFIKIGNAAPILMDAGVTMSPDISSMDITLNGGPNAGSLASVVTITDGTFANGAPGIYLDLNGANYNIPGTPAAGNTTVVLQAFFWLGADTTFAAAVADNSYTGSAQWSQVSGGGTTQGFSFVGMPAVILSAAAIPEPTSIALAGLGAAALLIVRRRK